MAQLFAPSVACLIIRSEAAFGRDLPVVTVGEVSSTAACYADLNGRDRPRADVRCPDLRFVDASYS